MPYQFATDATHGVMVELGSGLPRQTSPQHLAHPQHASTSICAFYYLYLFVHSNKLVSVDFLILRPVAAKGDFGKNMKELWQVLVLTNVWFPHGFRMAMPVPRRGGDLGRSGLRYRLERLLPNSAT